MTVHQWLENWAIGEVRMLPKNVTVADAISYAQSRFDYMLTITGGPKPMTMVYLKRVCPHCGR